jgi:glycine cleavage system H protein
MKFPSDIKYHPEHTWVKIEGDVATIGITDHAQDQLGEILFVDLPEVEETTAQGDTFGSIESAKVASDLYAPISGEIIEVNEKLDDDPELVRSIASVLVSDKISLTRSAPQALETSVSKKSSPHNISA